MKKASILFTLALAFLYLTLQSYSSGISGYAATGCSCHGTKSGSTSIEIDSAGIPVTNVIAGNTYTINVTYTPPAGYKYWGIDFKKSAGVLTAGTGYKLSAGDLTHSAPLGGTVTASYTYPINWTAPSTSGNVTFYYAMAAGSSTGTASGPWQKGAYTIYVNTSSPAPSSPSPILGATEVCPGSDITLTDATTGGIWSSSNDAVATITTDGVVTGVAAGQDTISYVVSGDTVTQLITVNPTPDVTVTPTSQTVSNNANTTTVNFSSSVSATTYTWTNSNTAIGTGASGSGSSLPSFIATNTGTGVISGVFTVTPTANGCVGATQTFSVAVTSLANCLSFDGVNDYVQMGDPVSQQFDSTGAFSTEMWVNPATVAYGWYSILGKLKYNDNAGFQLYIAGEFLNLARGNSTILYVPISANTWTHVATTYNNGTWKLYINGVLQGSATGAYVNPSTPWSAGMRSSNGGVGFTDPYSGLIDDIRIWGTERTQTQIQDNMNCSIAAQSGLLSYYRFDQGEAAGSNAMLLGAYDYSGNGNCGALTNFDLTGTTSNYVTGAIADCNPFTVIIPAATITGNTSVCPGAVDTFMNAVAGGTWSSSDSNATIDPVSGIMTAVSSGTTTISYTLNCVSATQSVTIYPIPTVNAVANQTVCAASPSTAVTFGGAVTGTTYNWTNSNTAIGLATSGSGDIASFTAANSTSAPDSSMIVVTTVANGCTGGSDTFMVTVNPVPQFNTVTLAQSACNGAASDEVVLSNTVPGTVVAWTNDNTAIGIGGSDAGDVPSYTATNTGSTDISGHFHAIPTYTNNGVGCTGGDKYWTMTVHPTPSVDPVANQTICNAALSTAVTFSGAVSGTTYSWTNDNSSINLASTGTGNIASFTAANSTSAADSAMIVVTPTASGCPGATGSFTITVNPVPQFNTVTLGQSACNGAASDEVVLSNTVPGTVVAWTNDNTAIGIGGSGAGDVPSYTATNTGSTDISGLFHAIPTYTNNGVGCTGGDKYWTMTVHPTPSVDPVANQIICNAAPSTTVTFSGPATGTTYSWTNDNTSIGLAANGTGDIASFTATNAGVAPIAANINVTTSANGCAGATGSFTLTVNPTPSIDVVANQTVCNNSSTTQVNFTGSVAGTTYNWVSSNTAIGIAASGIDSVLSFTALNPGTVLAHSFITITPTANSCAGSNRIFEITVDPTPTVDPVSSQALCNGAATTNIHFTSGGPGFAFAPPPPPTIYNWTNTDTTIGLTASGSGDIASFATTNPTDTIKVATITVTPVAGGCAGASQTFTITVYPTPNIAAVSNQTLCHGVATASVNFTGTVAGTTYSWTNTNPTIGIAASGADSIPSFTALNTGSAPTTADITVMTMANGCAGDTREFTFTVNPTPVIDTIASQVLCNTFATTTVNFTGAVEGTTYSWSNTNPTIGIPATGADSIGSFTALNTASTIQIATVTVTPSANGCTGASRNFTITINPTPDVVTPADQTICNTFASAAVNFSGSVALTAYSWTNTDTTIGLTANGSGNISSFAATDTTSAPVTATITVTPSANSCIGAPQHFAITVNPTPVVLSVANQTLCNTFPTASVYFAGPVSGSLFSWTNTDTTIGIAASGADSIVSFTAANITDTAHTATIIVTPSANGCTGTATSYTYTVNPTPSVTAVANQTFCNTVATNTLTFAGNVAGAAYNWSNSNTTIGLGAEGIDSIVSFIATDTTNTPVVATITITPTANGCTGANGSFTFTVNPTPVLSSKLADTICSGAPYSYTATSPVAGTTYTWTRAEVGGISNAANNGAGTIAETLINTMRHAITVNYVYALTANGCGNTQNLAVNVQPSAPVPTIAINSPAGLCSHTMYQNFGAATLPPDTVQYKWTATNATVWAEGTSQQNALVNFTTSGNAVVTLTANITGFACTTKDTFAVNVGTGVSDEPTVIYFAGEFACIPSTEDSYQWGYDDLQLDSTVLTGEITQDYLNASPDLTNKYYWVMTTKGDCSQKTYYKAPTGVQTIGTTEAFAVNLYPNPTSETVTVAYKGPNDGAVIAEIYTMLGQRVMSMPMTDNKAVMNVSQLAAGNYLVSCYRNGKKIAAARMVKE